MKSSSGSSPHKVVKENGIDGCHVRGMVSNTQKNTTHHTPHTIDTEVLDEIDPLNVSFLLGVISGFWNYVVLIFGLLFIPVVVSSLDG